MDTLALQRSLAILEDRYRELREMGEKQLQTWEAEKDALLQQIKQQKDALNNGKKIREQHLQRIQTLESKVETLRNERDAASRKKNQAEEQLAAQQVVLQRLHQFVQRPIGSGHEADRTFSQP